VVLEDHFWMWGIFGSSWSFIGGYSFFLTDVMDMWSA
jgi:hypothetical protein